jgi:small subunit ribosomal protein S1
VSIRSLDPSRRRRAPQKTYPLWERFEEEGYGYERPKRGDIVTGTVLCVRPDGILVDIGAKRDGLVPARDLDRLDEETEAAVEVGNELPVYIHKPWYSDDHIILSISRGLELRDWRRAQQFLESGQITKLEVTECNRGGLVVRFGQVRGFVPASHVRGVPPRGADSRDRALQDLVGSILPVKVIEVNLKRRRLVLSHREAQRDLEHQRKLELLEQLTEGDVLAGTVTSLRNFGAFVDIGGADGLVHVSEVAHERVDSPTDWLEVGQEVKVLVLELDKERERIALSIKRLLPSPWDDLDQRYTPGEWVDVRVTNLVSFGAFAEIEPGVEGLIHVSELAEGNVEDPAQVVAEDQYLTTRILSIDPYRQRLQLSLRGEVAP